MERLPVPEAWEEPDVVGAEAEGCAGRIGSGGRLAGIREHRCLRGGGGGRSWIELFDAQVIDGHIPFTLVSESDPGRLVLYNDVGGEMSGRGGDSHGMGLGDDFLDGLSADLVVTCDERVPGFVSLVVEGDAVPGSVPGQRGGGGGRAQHDPVAFFVHLQGPVTAENRVHGPTVPTFLGVRLMATGQLGPGISFHACTSRDEGPVTGVDVLEVLEENGRRRDVRVVGHSSVNDSEVIGADDSIPGERLQGNGDWSAVRVESNSQPLVVGAEILVGSGGVDGCRGRDDGFRVAPASLLVVDGSDSSAVDGKSHRTGLGRIYLDPRPQGVVTSRQIEDLGDLRLCLAELKVEVATVVVLDRDVSSGIPTSGVTGVEAWIDEVTSLSPIWGSLQQAP